MNTYTISLLYIIVPLFTLSLTSNNAVSPEKPKQKADKETDVSKKKGI